MRLQITTNVEQSAHQVMAGFNEELFLKLNPPFPQVRLLRFDGSKKGDIVGLELNFIFFKQRWVSEITFDEEHPDYFLFIDEGRKLPFMFTYWKHEHRIEDRPNGSAIIDRISYESGTKLLSFLLYPVLILQFMYRKPIYKKFFRQAQAW